VSGADAAAQAGERGRLTMLAAPQISFVITAYAAAFAVIVGLVTWVMFDYRAQLRKLADLEKRGVTRRSTPGAC
jgi:heme exporter protein D